MSSNPWDELDRVGVPGVMPREQADLKAPVRLPDAAEEELRGGDTGLGRPTTSVNELSALSIEDLRQLQQSAEAEAARDLNEAEELLASKPELAWAGWLAHPLAVIFLLGMAGVLGLFLTSQAASLLGSLASQPTIIRYAGWAALALFGTAILVAVVRLFWLYLRLQQNRQLRIQGLVELQSRTRMRWLVAAKSKEARGQLEKYLKSYPIQSERDRQRLQRYGLDTATIASLEAVREELLDPNKLGSTVEWVEHFRDQFQARLEVMAASRVKYWGNRAMLTTAIAPNGIIDSLATLYFGFAMIEDLCRIYNLKAGRTGTAVLLGRVFFNAYLAGNMGDLERFAEDQYDQLFEQGFRVVGIGVGTNVAGKFLGKVGAKATTGYLNRILLFRLGKYACRLLRPVHI